MEILRVNENSIKSIIDLHQKNRSLFYYTTCRGDEEVCKRTLLQAFHFCAYDNDILLASFYIKTKDYINKNALVSIEFVSSFFNLPIKNVQCFFQDVLIFLDLHRLYWLESSTGNSNSKHIGAIYEGYQYFEYGKYFIFSVTAGG